MENVISQVELEKDIFEVKINFINLAVSKDEIISTLGYVDGAIPKYFAEMIDDIFSRLPKYCEIKAGYRLVDVKESKDRLDGLFIGGKFFKLQNIVTSKLRKSEIAALFVCTIGQAMELWIKKLYAEGDAALSYIVDAVASATVEQATDVLHDQIKKQMQMQGLKITNRYSPGYCNWSVSEQHLLFSFFPHNFCGINLTESALMVPIKSVSGIVGVGTAVKRDDYTCDVCGVKDCTNRSISIAKEKRNKKILL